MHSYPELSLQAWLFNAGDSATDEHAGGDEDETEPIVRPPIVSYAIDDMLKEGCFLERKEIERLLERLRTKKNLISGGAWHWEDMDRSAASLRAHRTKRRKQSAGRAISS